ncbi:MAG TPA: DinB family protein [Anaerolineales bacterium]|nr:DinB family protein [Anaerolineales bacterium]
MQIKEYIQQAFNYTYWANRRYLAVAEGLPQKQLLQQHGHSWGSVQSVLLHMLSSETVWLRRWNGDSPSRHLDPNDYPSLAAVKEKWLTVEREMQAFIGRQTEDSLAREISYTNFSGNTYHVPLWQMLMHVPNHETHHRGELAAMFALMQVPHPEEEAIQYFLDLSGQKKAQ